PYAADRIERRAEESLPTVNDRRECTCPDSFASGTQFGRARRQLRGTSPDPAPTAGTPAARRGRDPGFPNTRRGSGTATLRGDQSLASIGRSILVTLAVTRKHFRVSFRQHSSVR